ncbi:MAG: hypothetical protein HC914_18290, partial [Chloroflexaceae bacterium]|nr:hypothetical protein [Chloroflexaceae bacterium]
DPSVTPSATPTRDPSVTPSATPTRDPSVTPSATPTATATTPTVLLTLRCSRQVAPGERFTCTVIITNPTADTVRRIRVVLRVPRSVVFDAIRSTANWRLLTTLQQAETQTYALDIEAMAPNEELSYTFAGTIDASVPEGTELGVDAELTTENGNGQVIAAATESILVQRFRVYLPLASSQTDRSLALQGPDFIVDLQMEPDTRTLQAGEPVIFTVVVTNRGNATITEGFWVDMFINPALPPTPSELPTRWDLLCTLEPCFGIVWEVLEPLLPGESITLRSTPNSYSTDYTFWPGWLAAGTTDVYVYVDGWSTSAEGNVIEIREDNNRAEIRGLTVQGNNPSLLQSGPRATRPAAE